MPIDLQDAGHSLPSARGLSEAPQPPAWQTPTPFWISGDSWPTLVREWAIR